MILINALLLYICCVLHTHCVVCANSDYYVAAVVEFRPNVERGNTSESLQEHLTAYIELINSSAAREADIIVFPECTLNAELFSTLVPKPEAKLCPCTDADADSNIYEEFLVQLSCAARAVQKYLVINVKERERCTEIVNDTRPCRADGWNIFNTNVVFDRRGIVVSRYRKWNLYLTEANRTLNVEYAIFDTDFGVRFAHFICFDILFYTPARELVASMGVQNIIFTVMFYSELPFLTAAQLQQSWAWGNDVNLLAAGASLPLNGSTGTGIYAGSEGALVSSMVGKSGIRKLYTARLLKRAKQQPAIREAKQKHHFHTADIRMLRDPVLDNFTSALVTFSSANTNMTRQICHKNFCCSFTIEARLHAELMSNDDQHRYRYRIGAFNGWRRYEEAAWSRIRICGMYACANDSVSSCGLVFGESGDTVIEFEELNIVGEFPHAKKMLIMPNTLDFDLYSLNSDELQWRLDSKGQNDVASMRLTTPRKDLLTFAIYANYYDGDECETEAFTSKLYDWFGYTHLAILAGSILFVAIVVWRWRIR